MLLLHSWKLSRPSRLGKAAEAPYFGDFTSLPQVGVRMSRGSADLMPTSWPLTSEQAFGSVLPSPYPPPRLSAKLAPPIRWNQGTRADEADETVSIGSRSEKSKRFGQFDGGTLETGAARGHADTVVPAMTSRAPVLPDPPDMILKIDAVKTARFWLRIHCATPDRDYPVHLRQAEGGTRVFIFSSVLGRPKRNGVRPATSSLAHLSEIPSRFPICRPWSQIEKQRCEHQPDQ